MGVEITGKLTDGVTASHTHGPSNDTLATTAPKDNGGTGEHFSPTDLLTTGYAACTTTLWRWARPRGYGLDGVQYSVEKIGVRNSASHRGTSHDDWTRAIGKETFEAAESCRLH